MLEENERTNKIKGKWWWIRKVSNKQVNDNAYLLERLSGEKNMNETSQKMVGLFIFLLHASTDSALNFFVKSNY